MHISSKFKYQLSFCLCNSVQDDENKFNNIEKQNTEMRKEYDNRSNNFEYSTKIMKSRQITGFIEL